MQLLPAFTIEVDFWGFAHFCLWEKRIAFCFLGVSLFVVQRLLQWRGWTLAYHMEHCRRGFGQVSFRLKLIESASHESGSLKQTVNQQVPQVVKASLTLKVSESISLYVRESWTIDKLHRTQLLDLNYVLLNGAPIDSLWRGKWPTFLLRRAIDSLRSTVWLASDCEWS